MNETKIINYFYINLWFLINLNFEIKIIVTILTIITTFIAFAAIIDFETIIAAIIFIFILINFIIIIVDSHLNIAINVAVIRKFITIVKTKLQIFIYQIINLKTYFN